MRTIAAILVWVKLNYIIIAIIPNRKMGSRRVYLTICPVRTDVHASAMLNGIVTKPIFQIPSVQPTNACDNIRQQISVIE